MKLVTVAQMRELERIAIEEYGVLSLLLMENAAQGFVSALASEYSDFTAKKVHVFCGKGNNGGDGFAIARMLKNRGASVCITLLCEESEITNDAKTNFDIVKHMGIPFVPSSLCVEADVIVDAIFGTGFRGETEGIVKTAIAKINESNGVVAAVDIPSGVSADTGHASETAVYADLCVTFAALKPGHILFPGKEHSKKLVQTDISIPQTVINDFVSGYAIIDASAFDRIPARQTNSHKGSFGKAIAYVGSRGMSGAACLSTTAILKSGAGMATAAIPGDISDIVASKLTAAMTCPLPERHTAEALLGAAEPLDVLLMGCGIGRTKNACRTVKRMLKTFAKPMVLDADAIYAVCECPHVLKDAKGEVILTPHIGEFSTLSGLSVAEIKANPLEVARTFSQEYNVTLVLKDAVTVVATKEGKLYVSAGSNSGMATAGSGDVLAGIITGLLAQGATCETAAVCGVYLHLAAGELARQEKGEYGMTAEDLLHHLPYAFLKEMDIAGYIKE